MGTASSGTATFASTKGTLAAGYGGAGSLTLGGLNTGISTGRGLDHHPHDQRCHFCPGRSRDRAVPGLCGSASNVLFYVSGVLSGSGVILSCVRRLGIRIDGAAPSVQTPIDQRQTPASARRSTVTTLIPTYIDLVYSVDHPVWTGHGRRRLEYRPQSPTIGCPCPAGHKPTSTADERRSSMAMPGPSRGGGGTTTVSLSGSRKPASVTFGNNSLSYTLTGASGITGRHVLTKNGSVALTIATSNSYTGGTTINAGRLNIANSAALGGPTNGEHLWHVHDQRRYDRQH